MDAPPLLACASAIALIKEMKDADVKVLGLDGFVIIDGGRRADLELILDISKPTISVEDAATKAIAFLKANERSNVVWEVVSE